MQRVVWVVAPLYLDVDSFEILRDRVRAALASEPLLASFSPRFVVADDTAGRDPEVQRLVALSDVTIIRPPFNLGHQRAIVFALRTLGSQIADDDLVVTMDSDGEDAPNDVPRLIAALLAPDAPARAVVVAQRTSRQESLPFKAFYFMFRTLFLILTGETIRSGNFAAYEGRTGRSAIGHPSFDVAYSAALLSLDLPIVGVPCARASRYAGQSRMSFAKLIRHGLGMFMPYIDRIAIRALILFMCIISACIALSILVLVVKFGTAHAIPGWATATLLGLWISSLVAIGNFVILFAVYTQSRGMALSRLEQEDHGRS